MSISMSVPLLILPTLPASLPPEAAGERTPAASGFDTLLEEALSGPPDVPHLPPVVQVFERGAALPRRFAEPLPDEPGEDEVEAAAEPGPAMPVLLTPPPPPPPQPPPHAPLPEAAGWPRVGREDASPMDLGDQAALAGPASSQAVPRRTVVATIPQDEAPLAGAPAAATQARPEPRQTGVKPDRPEGVVESVVAGVRLAPALPPAATRPALPVPPQTPTSDETSSPADAADVPMPALPTPPQPPAFTQAMVGPPRAADALNLPPPAIPVASQPPAPPQPHVDTPRSVAVADVPPPALPAASPPKMPAERALRETAVAARALPPTREGGPEPRRAPTDSEPVPAMDAAATAPSAPAEQGTVLPLPTAVAVPAELARPAPTVGVPAAEPPRPLPPGGQVAPVITALAMVAPGEAPHSTLIRLDPAGLGHVQVRIDHAPGEPARVELVVERTDTLIMLMQDRQTLDQALDVAGLLPDARSLKFSLAGQDSGPATGAAPGRPPGAHDGGGQPGARDERPRRARRWQRAGIDFTA